MTDLHIITDPVELARAILAMPCSTKGEAATLGAHAHRLAEMLADAADEAKAADLHRNLNRRVAEALGLTDWQTDPETGEKYLPSWHDMPEKVEALRYEAEVFEVYRKSITTALGIEPASCAADVTESVNELRLNLAAAERDLASARELLVEATAMLAAELGKPEGAPSARWTCDGRTWRGAREDGGIDKVELHAILNGDGTVEMARVWSEEDRFGFEAERGRFDLARAAMIAADKAIGQPVQAPDPRPSNVLLTLTPALQKRVEALGYTPGETPAGVLPWLVAYAEESRQDVTFAAGELLIPIPDPGSDLSRLMIANRLLKGCAEKVGRELTEAQKSLARWENQAAYLLDHTPGATRVREGGGPENLRASVSLTWMKLCKDAARLAEVLKPVGEIDVEQLRKRYGEGTIPPCRVCGAELKPAEGDYLRTIYACPGGDWSTGKWAPFVEGRTLADAHYSASRVEIANGDPDVIALLNALLTERAKPRPWLVTETEGSTCVAATSKETAWAAYEATVGDSIEFDDTEYHVHEVTVKDVDEMLEAALTADEELHKAKRAASVAEKDAEEKGKVLDEIRTALGNGADEALWPPGKTLGEAVQLLATMPFEVRALAKLYNGDGDSWTCLRCGCEWPCDVVTACANCHQSESAESVLIQAGADTEGPRPEGCDCANPPPFPGAEGAWGVSCACPVHGDEDDIEEEPVP